MHGQPAGGSGVYDVDAHGTAVCTAVEVEEDRGAPGEREAERDAVPTRAVRGRAVGHDVAGAVESDFGLRGHRV